MADFILYTYPFPTRAERISWLLRELNFTYTVNVINPAHGEQKTAQFTQLNPNAKMPVVVYQGKAYTESLAILEWLNKLHPERPFIPTQPEQIYTLRQALSYGMTEIEPYCGSWHSQRN